MTDTLKPCPFCGGEAALVYVDSDAWQVICDDCGSCSDYYDGNSPGRKEAIEAWNDRQVEDTKLKYEPTSYSCRACKNATDEEIKRLRKENQKYEDVLVKIAFCCAAVECSTEMQIEALKAIDMICKKFYSITEEELRGKND